MDLMLFLWYSVSAVALLVVGVPLSASRRMVERDLELSARELDLALPADTRRKLLRRRRAVRIGDIVGAAAALELGAWIALTLGDGASDLGVLTQLMILIGGGIGSAIGGLVAARFTQPSDVRIARDRIVSVADYLHPAERWTARGAGLLGIVASGTAVLVTGGRPVTLFLLAAAVVTAAVFEVGARRVVAAPQPVGTVIDLAWSDATRAVLLRGLACAAAGVETLSTILAVPEAVGALSVAPGIAKAIVLPVFVLALVIPVWNLFQTPARYAVARLWPEHPAPALDGTTA